jgi:hypothetical protein
MSDHDKTSYLEKAAQIRKELNSQHATDSAAMPAEVAFIKSNTELKELLYQIKSDMPAQHAQMSDLLDRMAWICAQFPNA